ncbi:MAG: hypothetical protein NC819_03435 [Candidatus Omnitrophica bacterium]|nr:hypothetical protein [Candidatus Omnitrophota bacterium]
MSRETDRQITVVLTGAAAGSIMGSVRPSLDIDFGIDMRAGGSSRGKTWASVEAAVRATSRKTGIAVNFSENLDRWSSISLLDYAGHTKPYKRFGRIHVRVLEPAYWAIGKLSRYVQSDISDLRRVLKTQSPSPLPTVRLWGKALKASPRSTACFQFRQHVEHFLQRYAREIWGDRLGADRAIREFRRAASIRLSP